MSRTVIDVWSARRSYDPCGVLKLLPSPLGSPPPRTRTGIRHLLWTPSLGPPTGIFKMIRNAARKFPDTPASTPSGGRRPLLGGQAGQRFLEHAHARFKSFGLSQGWSGEAKEDRRNIARHGISLAEVSIWHQFGYIWEGNAVTNANIL